MFTVAVLKLQAEIRRTSVPAVAARMGISPVTLRLLCGGGDPRCSTMTRAVQSGLVQPPDWFTASEQNVS